MAKHTPGPWAVDTKERPILVKTDGYHIAQVFPQAWMTESNARLIAAAPEMFDLLKRMDQIKGEPNDFDLADWLFDLRALIAKVEGQG